MITPHPFVLGIFSIDPGDYKSISLDSNDALLITMLVYGICAGIVLAALYTLYQKSIPGELVRALIKAEATSPETAKSLGDLALPFVALLRFELAHNPVLTKTVLSTGEGEMTRYYIPEELKYRADERFEKKGNGLLSLLLTCLFSFALALLLFLLIPVILSIVG